MLNIFMLLDLCGLYDDKYFVGLMQFFHTYHMLVEVEITCHFPDNILQLDRIFIIFIFPFQDFISAASIKPDSFI